MPTPALSREVPIHAGNLNAMDSHASINTTALRHMTLSNMDYIVMATVGRFLNFSGGLTVSFQ